MFKINEDKSIYVTRGDAVTINLGATTDDGAYTFRVGDIVRFKVYGKKSPKNVYLAKDTVIHEETELALIELTGDDTKFGEFVGKPTDYWYEVELNPDEQPNTIIGYDEDGAKVFRVYPEGGDMNE